jgi:ParB-like chromosome segregation protein Spo0J
MAAPKIALRKVDELTTDPRNARTHTPAQIDQLTIPIIDGSGYSADEWKALSLADNQLALLAGWDVEQLTEQLDELSAANFDIEAIGFDQAALDALAAGCDPEAGGDRDPTGELEDSQFNHADQFAVIVRCKDEAEQEARFNRLRDEFGPDNVKVVVV